MRRILSSSVPLLLACALWGVTPWAQAQSTTVWEIGKFDRSSLEFHARVNFHDADFESNLHDRPEFS